MDVEKINFLKTWFEKVVFSEGKLAANHTCIMMYAIHAYQESGNKEIFDFSPADCMKFASIKSYNTFKKHLHELQYDFGMLEVHEKAVNQYTPYKVSLARFELYNYQIEVIPHANSLPPDVVQSYQNNKMILDRMKKLEADGLHNRKMSEEILSLLTKDKGKKKKAPVTDKESYWEKIVDAYFKWYPHNVGNGQKPDWGTDPSESKAMKQLIPKIKSRVLAAFEQGETEKELEWNEDTAPRAVIAFLTAATLLEAPKNIFWYKNNFSIRIINLKFPELYVALQEKRQSARTKGATDRTSTNERIDDLFAKGKNKQGR